MRFMILAWIGLACTAAWAPPETPEVRSYVTRQARIRAGLMDGPLWTRDGGWDDCRAPDGFGDPSNHSAAAMAEFGGDLYVGVGNAGGCEVWRTSTPIFADDFESGTTSAWSVTVP